MFYVLYSPSSKQYMNEIGELTTFEKAEQFRQPSPVILDNAQLYVKDLKWVGPCKEGEEP